MKKRIIIAGCVVILLLAGGFAIQMATLDGVVGFITSLLWDDSTRYAHGYSNSNFRKVAVGMTETEVHALLGEPLDVHSAGGKVYLWYSQPKRSHFRDRRVILQHGVVVEKNAEFYVD
jgi:outer membrane protein assembly factor BamE (lipoprotein component of BamABCDE complex)